MSAAGRIAVLKGGPSLERHVSLRSGAHAQEALERLGHEVLGLDLGPDLVPVLRAERPDVAFIALHGRDGEDGTVQALLEAIGIPYTGSGPAACARCTDKALAKHLMREAGIPTPDFHFLREDSIKQLGAAAAVEDIEDRLGLALVVKPARQGSALGVKFARASDELPAAMVGAFSYDDRIVIERYVKGRDLAVSVLDSPGGEASTDGGPGERSSAGGPGEPSSAGGPGERSSAGGPGERSSAGGREGARDPVARPVVEAVPREEEFYDYESRYESGMTTFVRPAELGERTTARAQRLAVAVYKLLGCHGVARVDLMLAEEDDELWVLETNVV